MKHWKFDENLFRVLDDITGYSFNRIAQLSGIQQQAISRYVTGDYALPLQILIKICNAIRFPIYYLIKEDDSLNDVGRHLLIAKEDWKPVYFSGQASEHIFSTKGINWKDVGEAMGMAQMNAKKRFLGERRFPVNDFIQTCNRLNLSPFLFLIDPNRKPAKRSSKGAEDEILTRIDTLQNTLAALQQKYDLLAEQMRKLQEDKASTTRRYADDGIFMAAEQETIFKTNKKK